MRTKTRTGSLVGAALGLGAAAAVLAFGCGGQKLVAAPPYTLPAAIGQAVDVPGSAASHPDAGHVRQPMGCQPESPPKFCHQLTDCQTGDICISYSCEPACFSQCGDFPPGLPNCPQPLICNNGVCVPPLMVTSTTGGATTAGTTTSGGTGRTTSSSSSSSGGGTTGGVSTTTTTSASTTTTTTSGGTTGSSCTDPDLSGDWTQNSTYYIATGVANGYPGLLGIINEVSNFLNTWSYAFFVPSWVPLIFNDLTGFDALFQNLQVQADMQLVADASNPWSYTCTETWQQVSVILQGQPMMLQPQNSYNSPSPYQVDSCTGTTTFENHDISGAVTGLIGPLLDAIVQADCQVQGCPYSSFSNLMSSLITDLIDCSQLNDGSLFGQLAQGACDSAESAVVADIQNAINNIPLGIGICTVQASVPTSPTTLAGQWQGNVSGTPFPGTLNATHN